MLKNDEAIKMNSPSGLRTKQALSYAAHAATDIKQQYQCAENPLCSLAPGYHPGL
ncbi:hypothetical protein [Mangrovibacterium diazotrophicum]|uniref:Uncharacterized protein n=1 Tax=Mangrovibacterium diazotrophicum TaxID=1261403 RepID=A0A419VUG6_9BACT|nr:hypothetical protein [Mangrovibacterium diazotrophicum]RKD85096.1 hypothetical protein BC643_4615 [Mangrovibacterium diazotrophicum]